MINLPSRDGCTYGARRRFLCPLYTRPRLAMLGLFPRLTGNRARTPQSGPEKPCHPRRCKAQASVWPVRLVVIGHRCGQSAPGSPLVATRCRHRIWRPRRVRHPAARSCLPNSPGEQSGTGWVHVTSRPSDCPDPSLTGSSRTQRRPLCCIAAHSTHARPVLSVLPGRPQRIPSGLWHLTGGGVPGLLSSA